MIAPVFASVRRRFSTSDAPRLTSSRKTAVDLRRFDFRPGQNISQRYQRLERSLRSKLELQDEITNISSLPSIPSATVSSQGQTTTRLAKHTFRGFIIPEEPQPPSDEECCMSGCAVCVYDLFEEARAEYTSEMTKLKSSLRNAHIPETEWPAILRTGHHPGTQKVRAAAEASLDAFAALEASLKNEKMTREFLTNQNAQSKPGTKPRPNIFGGTTLSAGLEALRWILFASK